MPMRRCRRRMPGSRYRCESGGSDPGRTPVPVAVGSRSPMVPDTASHRAPRRGPRTTLFAQVRSIAALHSAWRVVRTNAQKSEWAPTREAAKSFELSSYARLKEIQSQLAAHRFEFKEQKGVLKRKPGSDKRRPLVSAPLVNRIVQRAILDIVQGHPALRPVLRSENSFGGIPGRGPRDAIAIAAKGIGDGAEYFARSDIKDFFTKIPRERVRMWLHERLGDQDFCELMAKSAETKLDNLADLVGFENSFPLGDVGVAQGSALSALMGNILLFEVDAIGAADGITFVRYIDDFLVLGADEKEVAARFGEVRRALRALGLDAYNPGESKKASRGLISKGFEFLGVRVQPGHVWPTRTAIAKLFDKLTRVLESGKATMRAAVKSDAAIPKGEALAQTLVRVDRIIEGWGNAVSFCTVRHVLDAVDARIERELKLLWDEYRRLSGVATSRGRLRRLMGVRPVTDIREWKWADFSVKVEDRRRREREEVSLSGE